MAVTEAEALRKGLLRETMQLSFGDLNQSEEFLHEILSYFFALYAFEADLPRSREIYLSY